jgi:ADP-ribose pyrophosphatase YjhB (NUDIX family)
MEETLKQTWVGGVCIRNNEVLLIHRINRDNDFVKEFFMFPGKEVQDDENIEDALRNAFEDFSVTVQVDELLYANEDDTDENEYFYICRHALGEPHIAKESDEAKKMEDGRQVFTPMWVSLRELDDLIVYPESVKHKLIEALQEE